MDMSDVSEYIRASKDVLDILKTLGGLLPKGEQADAAEKRLAEAEKALRASEAQLAKALDYHLCQCEFPPNIMLSAGRDAETDKEFFKCPKCEKQEPSARWLEGMAKVSAPNQNRRGRSWTDARHGR